MVKVLVRCFLGGWLCYVNDVDICLLGNYWI